MNQLFIIDLFDHLRDISDFIRLVGLEEQPLPKRDFEKFLLEAVDDGLSSLGPSSRQAIYFHLEKNFGVRRREIPCKIEAFADAIEKIFGLGAYSLEILIMKRLHEKIGEVFAWHESSDLAFVAYVSAVREVFLKKKARKKRERLVHSRRMVMKC